MTFTTRRRCSIPLLHVCTTALEAMLVDDATVLDAANEADSDIVAVSWGDNTLLEWVTQPRAPAHLVRTGRDVDARSRVSSARGP